MADVTSIGTFLFTTDGVILSTGFASPRGGTDGEVLEGKLPVKQYRILTGWMALHEDELYAAWNNAVRQLPFERINPLS